MTSDFNVVQKELVEKCERAHFEGTRHTGLSGTLCEDLLIRTLETVVPKLNFGRGVIKFGDPIAKGEHLSGKKDLSTQIDIIIYRGEPLFELEKSIVVPIDQVLGVIEVKKWLYPVGLFRAKSVLENLERQIKSISSGTGKNIVFFLVAFRFHDRNRGATWFSEVREYSGKCYCFFGNYSRHNGKILYPWEENIWQNFEDSPYAGQFEKLANDVMKLQKY